MDSAKFVQLLAALASDGAAMREAGAESAVDVRPALNNDEAQSVAMVLAHLAVQESDASAREALLHALAEYVEWSQAPSSVADVVSAIEQASLRGSELEYVAYIRDPTTA